MFSGEFGCWACLLKHTIDSDRALQTHCCDQMCSLKQEALLLLYMHIVY